jgi:pseudolysin
MAYTLGLVLPLFSYAARPLDLTNTTLQQVQKQFYLDVPGVKTLRANSNDGVSNALSLVKSNTDKKKMTHSRLQQAYAGFPVFGGDVIIHSKASLANSIISQQATTATTKMNGFLYLDLETDLGKAPADFVANKEKALTSFKAPYLGHTISDEEVVPLVYIDNQHKAHWAYQVSLLVRKPNALPEKPTAIIDAGSFAPFVQWNDIKSHKYIIHGKGYGGNNKLGKLNYDGTILPYLEMTRSRNLSGINTCTMENEDVMVVDMHHLEALKNKPMHFACRPVAGEKDLFWTGYQSNGLDDANGSFSPSDDALYAGYVIKHMYQDWYQVPALVKKDGTPMQLVMRVHYGENFENAYWYNDEMNFGDGGETFYPLVSLGVAAHEVSHGFTEQNSDLLYYNQSGGLNESFSDMAAQVADFYATQKNNWMIGAEIVKEGSGLETLRYMDIPSKDGLSIDSVRVYRKGMDPHFSSGVYNRLFYLMSTQEGWDVRKAFAVMVKANRDYWTRKSTFKQAACGVLSAAKDLDFNTDDIKKSMSEVKLDYRACT